MKPIVFKLIIFLVISIFLTSCSNDEETIYLESKIETKIKYSTIEKEILKLVNDYRVRKKLPSLKILNIISTVAETHSNYMVKNSKASHDNFPERQKKLFNYTSAEAVGENVAFGYISAQSVFNAWLKSESHKKIIEYSEYTHFGISSKIDKSGRNYFTQIFIKK